MNLNGKRIAIAKTNHMGDVIISLAMTGVIKDKFPKSRVIFLCRGHNTDLAKLSPNIDEVYDWDSIEKDTQSTQQLHKLSIDVFIHTNPCKKISVLAKNANIPIRVGSMFRLHHWLSCNRMAFISRSAKVNKRQLDLQYLKALGIKVKMSEQTLLTYARLTCTSLKKSHQSLLSNTKFNVVLHPGSVTASEHGWGIENYKALIEQLDKNKYHIIISGIEAERKQFGALLNMEGVIDLMGRMSLTDYANFISHVDGMVAGSTGPLHLANVYQKYTIGLYRHNTKDIKRWRPIGSKSFVLSNENKVASIPVSSVLSRLKDWLI